MASRRSGLQILAKESRIESSLSNSSMMDVDLGAVKSTELPFENQAKCRKRWANFDSHEVVPPLLAAAKNWWQYCRTWRIFVSISESKNGIVYRHPNIPAMRYDREGRMAAELAGLKSSARTPLSIGNRSRTY
jgi:hypothetical protein